MAMPEIVMKEWELLNAQNQADVQAYISRLLRRQNQGRVNPPRKLGILAHRFKGIAEDFDEPLPEFREYME